MPLNHHLRRLHFFVSVPLEGNLKTPAKGHPWAARVWGFRVQGLGCFRVLGFWVQGCGGLGFRGYQGFGV